MLISWTNEVMMKSIHSHQQAGFGLLTYLSILEEYSGYFVLDLRTELKCVDLKADDERVHLLAVVNDFLSFEELMFMWVEVNNRKYSKLYIVRLLGRPTIKMQNLINKSE